MSPEQPGSLSNLRCPLFGKQSDMRRLGLHTPRTPEGGRWGTLTGRVPSNLPSSCLPTNMEVFLHPQPAAIRYNARAIMHRNQPPSNASTKVATFNESPLSP